MTDSDTDSTVSDTTLRHCDSASVTEPLQVQPDSSQESRLSSSPVGVNRWGIFLRNFWKYLPTTITTMIAGKINMALSIPSFTGPFGSANSTILQRLCSTESHAYNSSCFRFGNLLLWCRGTVTPPGGDDIYSLISQPNGGDTKIRVARYECLLRLIVQSVDLTCCVQLNLQLNIQLQYEVGSKSW